MNQPTHIRATAPDDEGQTVANTTQHVFRAHSLDKPEMVTRILQAEGRGLAMIFCRTKRTAADVAEQLSRRGFAAGAVHGDLGQGAREQALRAFRNGKVDVLVCTDVAARGIDVDNVTHVINYQTPEDEKTYLHRIGRTGRAGASGTAVTLVDWDDIPRWQLINKALALDFHAPEETYSTSPHLYEALGIPKETKGVLPRAERTRAGLAAEEIEDLGEPGGRGPRSRSGATEERTRPARKPRQRRRTRGALRPGTGGAESGADTADTADAAEKAGKAVATAEATGAPGAEAAEGTAPRKPRRRRRTRAGVTAGSSRTGSASHAQEGGEAKETVAGADEAPRKPRRRRTRSGSASSRAASTAQQSTDN
jgi:superfamily II DNA/RNA helicase